MEVVGSEENLPPGEVSDAILQKEEMRSRRRFGYRPFLDVLASFHSKCLPIALHEYSRSRSIRN